MMVGYKMVSRHVEALSQFSFCGVPVDLKDVERVRLKKIEGF